MKRATTKQLSARIAAGLSAPARIEEPGLFGRRVMTVRYFDEVSSFDVATSTALLKEFTLPDGVIVAGSMLP